jgi:hypothetical protein
MPDDLTAAVARIAAGRSSASASLEAANALLLRNPSVVISPAIEPALEPLS